MTHNAVSRVQPSTEAPAWRKREMEVLIAQANMNNSFSPEQVSQTSTPISPISLGSNEWTTPPEESPKTSPAYSLYLDDGEGGPQVCGSLYSPEPVSILEEAITITSGARRRDYGHPYNNFRKTGVMWGTQLEAWMTRAKPGDPVPPRLVAAMMVTLKLIRDTETPKRDNPIDIAGYAYCMDEVTQEEDRRRLGNHVTLDPDLPQ